MTAKRQVKAKATPAGAGLAVLESSGERTEANAAAVNEAAVAVMALAVDSLRDQIEAIRAGRGGESRHDAGSRIAFLGARAGVLFEATRKALAARAKELSVITPALVLAWYRQLDRTERERILSELHAVDSRRSGLA